MNPPYALHHSCFTSTWPQCSINPAVTTSFHQLSFQEPVNLTYRSSWSKSAFLFFILPSLHESINSTRMKAESLRDWSCKMGPPADSVNRDAVAGGCRVHLWCVTADIQLFSIWLSKASQMPFTQPPPPLQLLGGDPKVFPGHMGCKILLLSHYTVSGW